jgi:hypothetical protein
MASATLLPSPLQHYFSTTASLAPWADWRIVCPPRSLALHKHASPSGRGESDSPRTRLAARSGVRRFP